MLIQSIILNNHHLKYIKESIKSPISLVKTLKIWKSLVQLNLLKYLKVINPKKERKVIPVRIMHSMGYKRYLLLALSRNNNLMMIITNKIKVEFNIVTSQTNV